MDHDPVGRYLRSTHAQAERDRLASGGRRRSVARLDLILLVGPSSAAVTPARGTSGLEAPLRSGQAPPAIRDQLEASFVEFGDVARAVDQSKLEGLVVFTGVAEDLGDRGEPVVAAPVLAPTGDAGRRA